MARAIRDAGHEVSSPWVLGPIEGQSPGVVNIFERDMRGAEESDAIVADVSQPSTGVGMELMAAYKAHRRIIVVARRGVVVSRMLEHMGAKEVVEFEDEDDLYEKLVALLRKRRRSAQDPWAQAGIQKYLKLRGSTVKREIRTPLAPAPVGPYSQAVEDSGVVYCSGQIGLDPATGKLEEGVVNQTRRALSNLSEVLKSAGLSLDDVIKITIFLADLGHFGQMNEEYSKHFRAPFPSRSTVQAAALPRGALVEIDAVARS